MKYDTVYIEVETVFEDKPIKLVQAKYWSEIDRCWKRVFHTYEIPDDEWLYFDKGERIDMLRRLTENTPHINKYNYSKFF